MRSLVDMGLYAFLRESAESMPSALESVVTMNVRALELLDKAVGIQVSDIHFVSSYIQISSPPDINLREDVRS